MIYFDNSATTKMHDEVLEAMMPYLKEGYGNPSSKYYPLAIEAKTAVENARNEVARLVGCREDEVIFTSGATESNNMIIKGIADPFWGQQKSLVTTAVEHSSVLESMKYLATKGFNISYLSVDKYGHVNIDELISELSDDVVLLSVMWGNNEIGALNDIEKIASLCKRKNIILHSDATQVIGKVDITKAQSEVPFMSISAHKFHGPKGIGAAIIKKEINGMKRVLTPLLHGGGQEFDYRSGTLNVPGIVGMGKAAQIAYNDLNQTRSKLMELEEYLVRKLQDEFDGIIHLNSSAQITNKIPGIVNVRIDGIPNELLIKKVSHLISLSSGSACSTTKPSHVLQGIGCSLDQVRSSLRISLSRNNTIDELNFFTQLLKGD
ncbi:cysteine desulfurase family protein [Paenibacillus sp. FSL W7-1287]|uniref:cysteine desulfurase family protein n=1 Tax=Paenibacillus sp. FSL W7-1287 TaxID=2954538 RepID=UPI0030F96F12